MLFMTCCSKTTPAQPIASCIIVVVNAYKDVIHTLILSEGKKKNVNETKSTLGRHNGKHRKKKKYINSRFTLPFPRLEV